MQRNQTCLARRSRARSKGRSGAHATSLIVGMDAQHFELQCLGGSGIRGSGNVTYVRHACEARHAGDVRRHAWVQRVQRV